MSGEKKGVSYGAREETNSRRYRAAGDESSATGADSLPPHSTEAEQGLLGCLILAADECLPVCTEARLTVDCFHDLRHRIVFTAICDLHEGFASIDNITLHQRLAESGTLDAAGGAAYVASLPDAASNPGNVQHYVEIVMAKAALRCADQALFHARRRIFENNGDARELLATISADLHGALSWARHEESRSIGKLVRPEPGDASELLRHRYLCRRGGALWVGNTGVGKSSLAVQAAVLWAGGRSAFRIEPTRPLTSLIIQAENDDGDVAEMRDGIYAGLQLTAAEREDVEARVIVALSNDRTGQKFLTERLAPQLSKVRPDIAWLDPLLSFLGGDASDQEKVSAFLRSGINPLLHRYECATIITHHTPKPRADPKSESNAAYAGYGPAELANWPRAVLSLEADGPVFALRAGKRGARLRWRDDHGRPVFARYLAHATDGIYWREAAPEQIAASTRRTKTKTDLLALVPLDGAILKATLIENARLASIGEKSARGFIDQLTSDGVLQLWKQPRPGTNPLISLSRKPQPEPELIVQ